MQNALKSVFASLLVISLTGVTLAQEVDGCLDENACFGGECTATDLATGAFECECPDGFSPLTNCETSICETNADCTETQDCIDDVCIFQEDPCADCTETQDCVDDVCVDQEEPEVEDQEQPEVEDPCADCTETQDCVDGMCVEKEEPEVEDQEQPEVEDPCADCTETQDCVDDVCVDQEEPEVEDQEQPEVEDPCADCTEPQDCVSGVCVDQEEPEVEDQEQPEVEDPCADCTETQDCVGGVCVEKEEPEVEDQEQPEVEDPCADCTETQDCVSGVCVDQVEPEVEDQEQPEVEDPCADCTETQNCVDGVCVEKENQKLKIHNCVDGVCVEKEEPEVEDPCVDCTETQDCVSGVCVDQEEPEVEDQEQPEVEDPCADCTETQDCVDGMCVDHEEPEVEDQEQPEVEDPCSNCTDTQECVDNVCVDQEEPEVEDPCANCTETEQCVDEACVDLDPCANCTAQEICVEGVCSTPICDGDSDCQNGGTCDVVNGTCSCATGFEGDNCETPIASSCACTAEEICVLGQCVARNCATDADCQNNGTCVADTGNCTCVSGFEGPTCSIAIDQCLGICTENQECINGACVEKKPEKITCGVATEELVVKCKVDQTVETGVECCRSDDSKCEGLPMCKSELCCKDPAPPSAAPTVSPMPSPQPQDITCGEKYKEGGLRCDNLSVESVETGKKCCREYGKCGSLSHCSNDFCCKVKPSPKPSPSAPPKCEGADDRGKCPEPVDHHVSCITGVYEGHVKCKTSESVLYQESCCRFAGKCGSLKTCTSGNCCTTDATPLPSPSKKPQAPSYKIKCENKYGLECYEGYDKKDDTQCCKYRGVCGSTPYCNKKQCCQLKPDEIAKPVLPVDTVGACWCDGVVLNNRCYPTLESAIARAVNDDVIYIANNVTVENPIDFDTDLVFAGVTCEKDREMRAHIVADFDSDTAAILHASNKEEQHVSIQYLGVTAKDGKSAAFFHGLGEEENAGDQKLSLELTNVVVFNMHSTRPGVGVWMGQSAGLIVDPDCVFINLTMSSNDDDRYAGGAAIAVKYLPSKASIVIGGTFANNSAFYREGSKHSGGGAIWMDWIEGSTIFTAQFLNNSANQGGAVMVQEVLGNMIVDGLFQDNRAIDDGYGSRAGAFRLWKLREGSQVLINGTFIDNIAQGRGGVVATNIHEEDSVLIFDGIFQSNVATDVGGVWSRWSNDAFEGRVILDGECTFEGNRAFSDFDQSDIYSISGTRRDKYSEKEWETRDSRTLYID
ncbi:hypothetical protein SARC_01787 [Sphaeroforma arctica JP610]|uniref:EGF-like domain-containing protein n=1 Tax=Sphaeroforma arctica JP610 TaxID=667725 RepID=A0A0L0GAZ8_9EUKA|nr:hypothetical protein SARC_01787 [Sphaeroforma arctica JP610]KNC86064.1 hypothetical protein SARC_01787 [Sphaeroforma arctica JP610]|eukprot:XP_014159966.1 hypothetical protein SARC_01787 [Sphaeroforma arctica JP610]